jgi:hypothetical protein
MTMPLDRALEPEPRILLASRELIREAFPDFHKLGKNCVVFKPKVYKDRRALMIKLEGCTLDSVLTISALSNVRCLERTYSSSRMEV